MRVAFLLCFIVTQPLLALADVTQEARFGSSPPVVQIPAAGHKLLLDTHLHTEDEAQLIALEKPQPIIEQPIGLLPPIDQNGPLSFEQLLQAAYAHHPLIRRSMLDQMVASLDVTAAKQAYYPTPNINVNLGENGRQVLSAGLTQPLYTFGKISTGVSQAQIRESIATLAIDEAKQGVALMLVNLWRSYLGAALQLTVLQDTLERYEGYHAMILRRFEAGRSSQADITFVESRISQTQADVKAAEARRNTTLSQLSQVTGLVLNAQSLRMPDLPEPDSQDLSSTIEQALSYSPQFKRIQTEVTQAELDAERSRANMLPNVNLNLQMDRYANGVDMRIYAPAAGVISKIDIETIGARVRPGEIVMSLLPTGSRLIVSAKMPPSEMAKIRTGLPTMVKLDAYDYTIYGTYPGKVVYISPDALNEKTIHGDTFYYKVDVELNQDAVPNHNLHFPDKPVELQPGMTGTVEVFAGSQTLLQYLLKPVIKTLSNALAES